MTIGSELKRAETLSRLLHAGHKYGDEPYFDAHVVPVVKRVHETHVHPFYSVVAYLHDIIEETSVTIEDLKTFGFHSSTIRAVEFITRDPDDTYFEYIERIAKAPEVSGLGARVVKIADLEENLSNDPPDSLRERYEKALDILDDTADKFFWK
jgi:hypothetical protein